MTRSSGVAGLLSLLLLACSSGETNGRPSNPQPGAQETTSSSGSVSRPEDGPASNNEPEGNGAGVQCTEYVAGGFIDPKIGGSVESQIILQSIADYAGRMASSQAEITSICNTIAQDLDAPADRKAAADANPDLQMKLDAWCKLAIAQLTEWRARVGGTRTTDAPPANCMRPNVAATCNSKCAGRPREADCNKACEITAAANVSCSMGKVKVTIAGSSTPADADKLKSVIEANASGLLIQKAILDGMMLIANEVSSTKFNDVKASCVPKASASKSNAISCVASATKVLVDAAGQLSQ